MRKLIHPYIHNYPNLIARGLVTKVIAPAIKVSCAACLCMVLAESGWDKKAAIAQIEAAPGSTNTQVLDSGTQIDIQGGATSGNRRNLFHGFTQFNIAPNQTVNFNADSRVENIFSHITGGFASTLDGTLRVNGSEANLYLVNPSGIIFGPNLQIQLSGNLIGTTASTIGFRNGQIDLTDSALGSVKYTKFNQVPTYLEFANDSAVVTLSDLAIDSQSTTSATLSGTGASSSTVVFSLTDTEFVRISQPGQLLSVELVGSSSISELSQLSQQLTGAGTAEANNIEIYNNTASLTATGSASTDDTSNSNTSTDNSSNSNTSTSDASTATPDPQAPLPPSRLVEREAEAPSGNNNLAKEPFTTESIARPVEESALSLSPKTAGAISSELSIQPAINETPLEANTQRLENETPPIQPAKIQPTTTQPTASVIIQANSATSQTVEMFDRASEESRSDLSSSDLSRPLVQTESDSEATSALLKQIEDATSKQFINYLNLNEQTAHSEMTLSEMQQMLYQVQQQSSSVRPALVYVHFAPNATDSNSSDLANSDQSVAPSPSDHLEVIAVTADGKPVRYRHPEITRADIASVSAQFRKEVTSQFSRPADYLPPAQQLYEWFIEPIESQLSNQDINSLGLVMAEGLRVLPLAALHDGNQFLVEKYSLGLIPAVSLTSFDTKDSALANQVLAMGASKFDNQPPLPAVEAELSFISDTLWLGDSFVNEGFTLQNLKDQIASERYSILHLATHAFFDERSAEGSYIQMWKQRLQLSDLQVLRLAANDVAMVILSACNTAIGDRASEYGFAGFALSAGSESALASLWAVSDEGTLGFMTQFYDQLPKAVSQLEPNREDMHRSEILRAAQNSLLNGSVGIDYGQLYGPDGETLATIEALRDSGSWDFSHPYYWSAFTMVGNPW